jgi:CarD family transcriptional regulator
MFKVNDVVIYGSAGICRIVDIRDEKLGDEVNKYYILKPVFDEKNTFFVPVLNENLTSKIHDILTYDEALEFAKKIRDIEPLWIDNDKERYVTYKTTLDRGSREEIVSVVKALREREASLFRFGKKLRGSDETTMRQGDKIIKNELAFVLNVPANEIEAI